MCKVKAFLKCDFLSDFSTLCTSLEEKMTFGRGCQSIQFLVFQGRCNNIDWCVLYWCRHFICFSSLLKGILFFFMFQDGKLRVLEVRHRCLNPTCPSTVWVTPVMDAAVLKWSTFSKVPTFFFSVTGFQIRLHYSQPLISGVLKSDVMRLPRLSFWSGASQTSG